jgi:hypothetical protein
MLNDVWRKKLLAGLRLATSSEARGPHGMQEVWGSNTHSSTA